VRAHGDLVVAPLEPGELFAAQMMPGHDCSPVRCAQTRVPRLRW
jgi:hypothetical protein